jgi:hypothetical protein
LYFSDMSAQHKVFHDWWKIFHDALWCLDHVLVGSASFHLPQLRPKVFLQERKSLKSCDILG